MVTGEGADAQGTPAEPDQPGDGARVRAVDGNGITSKDIIELLMMPMNSLHPRPGVLLAQQGPPALLEAALDRALLAVGQALLFPLAQALRDRKATQVVLIPCGPMGLLPLQAAWWREEGVVRHFLDEVTVSYAPSAVIYRAARERARRLAGRSPVLVGLGNPLPSPLQLPAAQAELASIGQVFAGEQLDLACGAGAPKTSSWHTWTVRRISTSRATARAASAIPWTRRCCSARTSSRYAKSQPVSGSMRGW